MHLNRLELNQTSVWEKANIALPAFDIEQVKQNTSKAPAWIHFGAGNIFRAFPCAVLQGLLNNGEETKGLIVAEGYDYEIIRKIYRPHDNLGLLVTLKSDGSIEKTVIASVCESLCLDRESESDFSRLEEIFVNPSLQMASFTITEKGYSLTDASGSFLPAVQTDFNNPPQRADSYIGKLAALCHTRFLAGELPIALVSMDNCSHNGDKLRGAITAYARQWEQKSLCEKGFLAYLEDKDKVSFPWSMIDKITPRPDEGVKTMLLESGFLDADTVVTAKNTFVAPFVNAEETQYLVIEDCFPNGRPSLEKGGVIFTDRETVDKVEKMKVCTCLNPLHTALAVFGCLLGYQKISDEMKDESLVRLIRKIGYTEGLPVVVNPVIISPEDFIDNVVNIRLPNPFMPDTPQRIATDTSQKLSIRFGETIKAYRDNPRLSLDSLQAIPLVFAGWCRYLMGVDDNGEPFQVSPDPLYDKLYSYISGIKPGDTGDFHRELMPILENVEIFGANLYEVGLGEKVECLFAQLVSEKGAVREALLKI